MNDNFDYDKVGNNSSNGNCDDNSNSQSQNNKKFSFLSKNDRRSSAPGRLAEDFIPLNDSYNKPNLTNNLANNTMKNSSSFFQKAKSNNDNFSNNKNGNNNNNHNNNNSQNNTPLSASLSAKLGIVSTDDNITEITGVKRPLNLL